MTINFSNHETPLEDLPQFEKVNFNAVSSKLLYKSIFRMFIWILAILTASLVFQDELIETGELTLILSLISFFFIINFIDIILRQKFYGFALREKDILFRKGYIMKKIIVIPFNRIQHLSVSISFLDKFFGISSLQIYTAGGNRSDMNIPGLFPDVAQNLKNAISSKVTQDEPETI